MDYFEQKSKETVEKETFEKAYKKQVKLTKRILTIIFTIMGFIFVTAGTLVLLLPTDEPDADIIGYIFIPFGIVFLIVALCVSLFVKPSENAYEKYKKRVNRFGIINIYDVNAKIQMLEARIEELERRIKWHVIWYKSN